VNLSWSRIDANLVSCSVIDINQRKLAEQAAEENSRQYQQVTDHAPTSIVVLREGKITYANPTFRSFTGCEAEELMGKNFRDLIDPDDRDGFPALPKSPDAGTSLPGLTEVQFQTKTGETRLGTLFFTWIHQKGSPAILINLVDITEYERLKESVQNENIRRRGIISTAVHELQSPLQPIAGYLTMLTQNPEKYGVTEETKAILDRVAKSIDHERQVIDQMLELSVLEAEKIPIEYSPVSVPALLRSIIESGGYGAHADIAIDVPPYLVIDADQGKIATVIGSMLSNAVNYSKPPRKIRIVYVSSAQDTMHRLAIRDNGIGITNTQLDEIFRTQNPADLSGNGKKAGRIGLSLSIAKRYVQLHGGFISVDSVVNVGSTFTIHIPKQRPSEGGP